MTTGSSPTVRRRRLAAELKGLRLGKQMTGVEVSRRMEADQSWISRVESGRRGIKIRDLRLLLDIYEVTDESYREGMIELCRQASKRGWWYPYGDVIPEEFQVYVGLEAEADSVRTYQSELVPGLLQTQDYHRTLLEAGPVIPAEGIIERKLQVRKNRQDRLLGGDAPTLWVILNEAVLRRVAGSPETMTAQLHHLAEMNSHNNIEIQVLPFSAGIHPAMDGSFLVLGFPEQIDPDVVYLDAKVGNLYLEEPEEVRPYTVVFNHLRAKALDQRDSVALIHRVAKEMGP